jgi:hypothetical protein
MGAIETSNNLHQPATITFQCWKCAEEGLTEDVCELTFSNSINDERPEWRKALIICPFEDTINGKLTGEHHYAEWKRVRATRGP